MIKLASVILGSALMLAACVDGPDQSAADDFSDLAALDAKSDAFSSRLKVLGTLTYGASSGSVAYTAKPRFRGFRFAGQAGDKVGVEVDAETDGVRPVVWILTDKFKVVARSNDASLAGNFASINPVELHATGTYYVVFRERDLMPGTFSVRLASPNRSQPLVTAGCPGEWTDGATAGRVGTDLDFAKIAGAYTRAAVADLDGGGLTVDWPLPSAITFGSDGQYQATMDLAGAATAEQGTYAAANNLMVGPIVNLQPTGTPPTSDSRLLRVLGIAQAPGAAIAKLCVAQLQGHTGRAFALVRTP
jgi:hypothetical protein